MNKGKKGGGVFQGKITHKRWLRIGLNPKTTNAGMKKCEETSHWIQVHRRQQERGLREEEFQKTKAHHPGVTRSLELCDQREFHIKEEDEAPLHARSAGFSVVGT